MEAEKDEAAAAAGAKLQKKVEKLEKSLAEAEATLAELILEKDRLEDELESAKA